MSVKYLESQNELIQFLLRSGKARAELQSLLSLGLHRLDFGLNEWKNIDRKPSFNNAAATPPYPYQEKNLYINASNNLWMRTMWNYMSGLNEQYYTALLREIKRFEAGTYFFNKGIVYGNLGVSQTIQMKLDEGFANILKALIEDQPYSGSPAQQNFFNTPLFTQFENNFVKGELATLLTKLVDNRLNPIPQFIDNFLNALSDDQRVFFDYCFIRIMENLRIWLEKNNSFSANRLLSCSQDLCLFIEDYLKKKIGSAAITTWMSTNNKSYITLKGLISIKFTTVSLWGCGANSMSELDSKLRTELARSSQPKKSLRILTLLRNYSSHNIAVGNTSNVFYAQFKDVLAELIRSLCEIILLP